MPFKIKVLHTETKGTKTITVEHVIHISGGSGIEKARYYSWHGFDTNNPTVEILPPGVGTKEIAMEQALAWLNEKGIGGNTMNSFLRPKARILDKKTFGKQWKVKGKQLDLWFDIYCEGIKDCQEVIAERIGDGSVYHGEKTNK